MELLRPSSCRRYRELLSKFRRNMGFLNIHRNTIDTKRENTRNSCNVSLPSWSHFTLIAFLMLWYTSYFSFLFNLSKGVGTCFSTVLFHHSITQLGGPWKYRAKNAQLRTVFTSMGNMLSTLQRAKSRAQYSFTSLKHSGKFFTKIDCFASSFPCFLFSCVIIPLLLSWYTLCIFHFTYKRFRI